MPHNVLKAFNVCLLLSLTGCFSPSQDPSPIPFEDVAWREAGGTYVLADSDIFTSFSLSGPRTILASDFSLVNAYELRATIYKGQELWSNTTYALDATGEVIRKSSCNTEKDCKVQTLWRHEGARHPLGLGLGAGQDATTIRIGAMERELPLIMNSRNGTIQLAGDVPDLQERWLDLGATWYFEGKDQFPIQIRGSPGVDGEREMWVRTSFWEGERLAQADTFEPRLITAMPCGEAARCALPGLDHAHPSAPVSIQDALEYLQNQQGVTIGEGECIRLASALGAHHTSSGLVGTPLSTAHMNYKFDIEIQDGDQVQPWTVTYEVPEQGRPSWKAERESPKSYGDCTMSNQGGSAVWTLPEFYAKVQEAGLTPRSGYEVGLYGWYGDPPYPQALSPRGTSLYIVNFLPLDRVGLIIHPPQVTAEADSGRLWHFVGPLEWLEAADGRA